MPFPPQGVSGSGPTDCPGSQRLRYSFRSSPAARTWSILRWKILKKLFPAFLGYAQIPGRQIHGSPGRWKRSADQLFSSLLKPPPLSHRLRKKLTPAFPSCSSTKAIALAVIAWGLMNTRALLVILFSVFIAQFIPPDHS